MPLPGECDRDARGAFRHPAASEGDGHPRILLVGDSIAGQRAWVEVASQTLRARWPEAVIHNFGVSGYHPCQSADLLEDHVADLSPDLILVQLCPNDLTDTPVMVPLEDGRRTRFYMGGRAADIPTVILRSRLLSALWLRYALARVAQPHTPSAAEALGYTRTCLEGLLARAQDRGQPVAVVLFPLLDDEDAPDPMLAAERALRDLLGALGAPLLDLRPVLQARGPLAGWRPRSTDPLHPGRAAQQELIGPAVGRFLLEQPVLQPPSPGAAR